MKLDSALNSTAPLQTGTPRSGTPNSGTPRSGTPRSGTPRSGTPKTGKSPTWRDAVLGRAMRRYLQGLLTRLRFGTLHLTLPDGSTISGGTPGVQAAAVFHNWQPIRRLLTEGDLGFAESFVAGDWSSPDLRTMLDFCLRNEAAFEGKLGGKPLRRLIAWLGHLRHSNTRAGSRRNIPAHYDLGNDFYATWLDAGMSYSSAVYDRDDMTLEEAQRAKQDLVLRSLDVAPHHRVLEIGCGWGGLMTHISQENPGAQVTGITLSPAQRDHVAARGIPAASDVRLQDYRELDGSFDRIVSVEMFEAVGQAFWPAYFDTLRRHLTAGGVAVLQVITIEEHRFAAYSRNADFIQRHIFPGGMLPTPGILAAQAAAAGFALKTVATFGQCYARTLAEWSRRFEQSWPSLRHQFDEAFARKWRYYLAYCEAGFRNGVTDVGIYRLTFR